MWCHLFPAKCVSGLYKCTVTLWFLYVEHDGEQVETFL